ncbi:hypothetical protein ACFWOJ_29805 [Streptomyces sp. NPDC058439]|uniref:hypothetical protein n=1 Tax=Streptomyces sp. NPDC058439 TaxID=3346500 RepID=UPI0036655FA4
MLKDLLVQMERWLDEDHVEIFTTRGELAHWVGMTGDAQNAAAAYTTLLEDMLGAGWESDSGGVGHVQRQLVRWSRR